MIAKGLESSNGKIVLCADDSLCASLTRGREQEALFFGVSGPMFRTLSADAIHESAYCTFCGGKYNYGGMVYGHLGQFDCPKCGFRRPHPDLSFQAEDKDGKKLQLVFDWKGQVAGTQLPIPGVHNGYNAAAALLAVLAAGLPFAPSVDALSAVRAAFGRMERFTVGEREVCLILVKNPVGMDRALDFVAKAADAGGIMFLLNANDPDGRDVSWIWDVNFESHLPAGRVGVSGERCHDMALRLFYAGKQPEDLMIESDHIGLFDRQLADCPPGSCLYVLPNYTAMLALRANLARRYSLREFWR